MPSTIVRSLCAALLAAVSLPLALVAAAQPAHAIILPPATVTVSLTAPTIVVGDPAFKTVNATVKDAAGNNVDENATVAVTAPDSDVILASNTMTRRTDGTYRASYRASTTAGTSIIKVTASSPTSTQPVSGQATLTEIPGATATVTITLNPTHVPADGASTSTATITTKDQYGNGTPETVALGTGDGDDSQPGPVTTTGTGTYTATITASETPDVETIFASGGGKTGTAQLTEYGTPTALDLAINPASIVANGTSTATATATITDAGGRGVANQAVTITKPVGADSTVGPVVNNGNGTYSAVITSSSTIGADTYTAAATGTALIDSADLTETNGPATLVSLVVNPNTLVADGASQTTATATVTDANGNGVVDETVTITTNKNAVIGAVTHKGSGVYEATITAPIISGGETITAKAVNANKTGTAALNFTPGPANNVAVTLTPDTVVANGTSQSTAKATVTDVNGNKVVNETVVFSKAEGSNVLIGNTTNHGDGTYTALITSSTKAGLETITATTSNNKTGNAILTQNPGTANTIILALDPATVTADGTSQSVATATVTDVNGNKVLNETVTITKPTTGSDITVTPVTNQGDGTYKATITASTTIGTNTITAKAVNANKTTTATLTEVHGPVTSVVLTLNPTVMEAKSTNTSTATVTVKDANNNLVTDESVTITKPEGSTISVGPVTNNGNGTYTAVITGSTTAGVYTITATAPSSGVSDTEDLTLFGTVNTITVVATPSTVPADGTTVGTVKATLLDSGGRPVPNQTVQFSVDAPGNMTIVQPVTNHGDGTYSAGFKASTTPGTETLRATAGKTATTQVIEYGPASTVTLSLDPAAIAANGDATSVATATVKDANNNPVLNEIVSFATSGDVSVGTTTNHGNGTYSATLTASTTAGVEKITATATRAKKSGEANLTETPGSAAIVSLVLDPSTVTADGADTAGATATVTDANGNAVAGKTVTLSSAGDTTPANAGAMTDNGDGTYTGSVVASTTAGQDTITATVSDTGAFGTAGLTEVAGDAANISVSLSPSIIAADGSSQSLATATVTDANGNLVAGEDVVFATDGDTTVGDATDQGNGAYTAPITASTTAGDESISATIAETSITDAATLTESAGPVASVLVTLDPASIVANGASQTTASATVKDLNGNAVTDDTVAFFKDGQSVGNGTHQGDGVYTALITSSTTAGPKTITAVSADSGQSGSATLTETAGPLASFTLSLNPSTVVADGAAQSTATASLADAHGNAITDKTVTMATNGDAAVGAVTNHGNGTYSATVTSSKTAGAETITASIASLGASKTATLTETAGPAAAIVLSLNPSTVVADGDDESTATATVLDANENMVKDAVVTITTGGDASVGPVANKGDGTYTAPIVSSTTAGNEVITAAVTGTELSSPATLTETAGPASTITLGLSESSITANGTATSLATATVADAFGNPVKNETVTFDDGGGDLGVGPTTNKGDGTYEATLTASTTAGTNNVTATAVNANKTSAAEVLTETAGPAAEIVLTLAPSTVVANGTDTSKATATVQDANDNPVTGAVVTMATNGDASVGPVADKGDGTYESTITSSTTAASETITAAVTGTGLSTTGTLVETAGPATTITLALNPTSIVANGSSTSLATATLADANGNPVKNETVTFHHNGDVVIGATTNNGNGTYKATITSSKTAGANSITAKAVNANKTSLAQTLTETAASVANVVVALSPSTITANGADTSLVTVTVTDANGNAITNETVTVATNGDVKPGSVTNKGNGTYTATITASNTAGSEVITARATKADKSGTATLTELARPTGYWLTGGDAGIFNYGSAGYFGSRGGQPLNKPVVTMVANPVDRKGYWQVATDGGIFNYGSAGFFGSRGGQPLNAPVVGMAPTADGKGYWLVASDGGIFNYGNAGFFDSMGGKPLNKPIVGIVRTASGQGYWLVASDGGVFAFGDAGFVGSKGANPYKSPIVGFAPMPKNDGYWMVAQDGAVFAFGTAKHLGDQAGKVNNVVGIAPTTTGNGYYLAGADGQVYAFGDAVKSGSPADSKLTLVQPISGIDAF